MDIPRFPEVTVDVDGDISDKSPVSVPFMHDLSPLLLLT